MRIALGLLGAIAFAASSASAQPELRWPVDCTLGQDCFIEDYVDHASRDGQKSDFRCGLNTRDGHKGTDIALLDFGRISTGVDVFAAASGTVVATRDSMPDDRLMNGVTQKNACGNAVVIDHGQGWLTQYCHLRLGSVAVQTGERVTAGRALGKVGLSGLTNHPHLHLTVYHNRAVVDPFQTGPLDNCQAVEQSMWEEPPQYYETGFITSGFSNHVPSLDEVISGSARMEKTDGQAPLVVYAHLAHARSGDVLTLSASGPSGRIFAQTLELEAPKTSQMRAYGRKAPSTGWPAGEYLGHALLTRNGSVIAHRFSHVTVD